MNDPTLTVSGLTLKINLNVDDAERLRIAAARHKRPSLSKMAADVLRRVLRDDLVKAVLDDD